MHDHRASALSFVGYEADTTVADVETPWRKPIDEVEEAEMQVTLDGKTWCRELLGSPDDRTACDETFRFSITARRPPKLEGVLCSKCFTPREIAAALEAVEKAKREADAFVGINPRRRR